MINTNFYHQLLSRALTRALSLWIAGILSLAILLFFPSAASAREVRVEELCQIPVTLIANVPEKIQKGKSFRLTDFIIKPSNTYGVTISSSLTELTASNTNSNVYNQDFLRTDPSPTTGSDFYTAYYPDWVIDAAGEVGSEIEIKLKGSISQVGDLGEVSCTYTKTLAAVAIVAEETENITNLPSSNKAVVAFRVAFLDSYGRPIKDAKVKIDNVEGNTNGEGQASFTNILSGKKLITATTGEDRIQGEYIVENYFTLGEPAITLRKPAPPLYQNPFFIGGVSIGAVLLIIVASFAVIKRRKITPADELPAQGQPLQGIIQGSLTANQNVPAVIPETNQPIGLIPERPITPAPWQLPVDKIPTPISPLKTTNSPLSGPSTVQTSTNTTSTQEQASTSNGIQIAVTQLQPSPSPLPTADAATTLLPGVQVPQNNSPSPTGVSSNPQQGQPDIQQPPSAQ